MGGGGKSGDKDRINGAGAGVVYKSYVCTLLLYGSESWVVIGAMLKVLEGFHNWEFRRIVGMAAWRTMGR